MYSLQSILVSSATTGLLLNIDDLDGIDGAKMIEIRLEFNPLKVTKKT